MPKNHTHLSLVIDFIWSSLHQVFMIGSVSFNLYNVSLIRLILEVSTCHPSLTSVLPFVEIAPKRFVHT